MRRWRHPPESMSKPSSGCSTSSPLAIPSATAPSIRAPSTVCSINGRRLQSGTLCASRAWWGRRALTAICGQSSSPHSSICRRCRLACDGTGRRGNAAWVFPIRRARSRFVPNRSRPSRKRRRPRRLSPSMHVRPSERRQHKKSPLRRRRRRDRVGGALRFRQFTSRRARAVHSTSSWRPWYRTRRPATIGERSAVRMRKS